MVTSEFVYEKQWEILKRYLPDDLDASARAAGAMRRKRGQITTGEQLLRLLLMHTAGGLSLEQTVARAQAQGLPKINAMALHKRLCSSHRWLSALTSHLLEDIRPRLDHSGDCWNLNRTVRILDATDVQEPGATGTDWRIHYSLRLPEMCCDFFELTDAHGGESLRRLPVNAGDLVLVDRGYNDRAAVGQILDEGGDVVMRYHSRNFPLLTPAGQAFDPLKGLRKLKVGEVREWPVRFVTGGKTREARLCAIRKSTEQAERTLRKIKLKTKGKFERVKPSTLEFAKYVVVVCTVPSGEMSAQLALEFYRARWQVELAFKRLKSLLMLGQLPKKRRSPARHGCRAKS